jgi:hypothetical protein
MQQRYDGLGTGSRIALWLASVAVVPLHGVGFASSLVLLCLEFGRVRGS